MNRKYVNLLAIIGLIVIITLSVTSYRHVMQLGDARNWVIHSYQVIELSESVLANIYYAENKERSYLLTNNQDNLILYNEAVKRINSDAVNIQEMLSDNPDQYMRAVNLTLLLKQRNELVKANIETYKKLGPETALQTIESGKSKLLLDEIGIIVNDLVLSEKDLLIARSSEIYKRTYDIILIKIVGTFFSLGLILACVLLLNNELALRTRAEKKLRNSEEELIRLAYYDSLTGLPNRSMLVDLLNEEINKLSIKKTIVLFLMDIDNFKNINDSLSHDIGDELIAAFSERLHFRLSSDDIIARLGADEFVIIKIINEIREIDELANQIKSYFNEPLTVRSHKIFVTVSIGISIYPNNGFDGKTLLKNADIAMYKAKEYGRSNYQICTPEMSLKVEERALLDYHLHHALQRDEFILFYQPKLSLKSSSIIGVEALLRWNRPSIGLVSPDDFIGIAESNGLIVPISEWLIRKVCMQGKKWESMGIEFSNIAINISTRQFSTRDFAYTIKDILNETGFDPKKLEFEITERIMMENSFDNFAALRALKDLGIKITIDDFGTGYSSLAYLRDFPVDKIKIDKSFLSDIAHDNPNAQLVHAIIIMAHSLGIVAVAEGVETTLQVEILKSFDCDEVQGFLYNYPMAEEEIERLLSQKTN